MSFYQVQHMFSWRFVKYSRTIRVRSYQGKSSYLKVVICWVLFKYHICFHSTRWITTISSKRLYRDKDIMLWQLCCVAIFSRYMEGTVKLCFKSRDVFSSIHSQPCLRSTSWIGTIWGKKLSRRSYALKVVTREVLFKPYVFLVLNELRRFA